MFFFFFVVVRDCVVEVVSIISSEECYNFVLYARG